MDIIFTKTSPIINLRSCLDANQGYVTFILFEINANENNHSLSLKHMKVFWNRL